MPADALCLATVRGQAHVLFTTRLDGDLNADRTAPDELSARWAGLVGRPVTWLDEVHGTDVVVVHEPGALAGVTADAAVTDVPGVALGIWVGDCAPVALVSNEGVLGAAHAGWRGLAAGVLERTLDAMRGLGAGRVQAVLGPCIRAECYEFGRADLDALVERFGPSARATTSWGTPALDVPAAVAAVLAANGVPLADTGHCTACDADRWFSHRARADEGRHGMAVWVAP